MIKHEKRIILTSLAIGIIVTLILGATKGYSESIQNGISSNIIRFHVIANSDNDYDQSLKLLVRDSVLADLNSDMKDLEKSSPVTQIDETRKFLMASLNRIEKVARKVIEENGFNYDVCVELKDDVYFPTKKYGDISFPAGNYCALRITIGEGAGKNWWCVMFPPLCYIDVAQTVVSKESKQELKSILTEDEYDVVVSEDTQYKIKFKIVEWWQEKSKNDEFLEAGKILKYE